MTEQQADEASPAKTTGGTASASQVGADGYTIRTGADQPWDPEDLTIARGQDPTPKNVERARRDLAEWGPAAIERVVP
jgi:hypothetical protein